MAERCEIRKILVYEWDPLDISGNRNLHDEYDSIVDVIFKIENGPNLYNEVRKTLLDSETEFQIDPINDARLDRVADLLARQLR